MHIFKGLEIIKMKMKMKHVKDTSSAIIQPIDHISMAVVYFLCPKSNSGALKIMINYIITEKGEVNQ